ncbi:MAG: hypothetical protein Kow00109_24850 [Acidobacteriota bacterium]
MSFSRVVSRDRIRFLHFEAADDPGSAGGAPGKQPKSEQERLEEVEREAYQKGFEAGRSSGLQMAEQKMEAALARLAESMAALARTRRELAQETEADLIRLAVAIAEKVVREHLEIRPEAVLPIVREALDKVREAAPITLFVCAEDYDRVKELLARESENYLGREVHLKVNPEFRRGDCRVECPLGTVDGRLSEQFRRIEQALLHDEQTLGH